MAVTNEHHTHLLHPPSEVVQQQECLHTNCIHMQTCIIQVMISCYNLSYFQQKCIHKAKMCIYKKRNASLICSRNLTISYQAKSMVTFSAKNRLLVNHLESNRWWNLLFHSCQSLYTSASYDVDEWLDAMSNIGQWDDPSSSNECKSFSSSFQVAFAWKFSWMWSIFFNILKHDGYLNHNMYMDFFPIFTWKFTMLNIIKRN